MNDTCIGCDGMGSVWCPAEYSNGACRCGIGAGAHLPVQCLACKGTGVDSDGGEDDRGFPQAPIDGTDPHGRYA